METNTERTKEEINMEYIIMGFLFAIGWTWGHAVSVAVAEVLRDKMENAQWYREVKAKKTMHNNSNDIKVVRSQIGFRYEEES